MGRKRTGQVIRLADDRFKIKIETRSGGKRKSFSQVFYGNEEAAGEFLTETLEKLEFLEQHPEKALTINQLMTKYINTYVVDQVKPRTLQDYKNMYLRYIKPMIGKMLMVDFKVRDARDFYERMKSEKKLSGSVIRKVHFHLKGAFTYAVEMEWRTDNPLYFVKSPKATKSERSRAVEIPSIKETLEIFNACRTPGEKALWMTAYFTGMRPEEYLALRWKDVDFDKMVFKINRVAVQLEKQRPHFEDPKTLKSRRSQPMSEQVAAALADYRTVWLKMKMAKGKDWGNLDNEKDLVFCTGNGNIMLNSNLNRNLAAVIRNANGKDRLQLRRVKEAAKRKYKEKTVKEAKTFEETYVEKKFPVKVREDICPYSMRHAFASHLLETGATLKDVSDLLAHSSIRLTADTYVHITEERKTHAVDRLEQKVLKQKMVFVKP